MNGTVLAGMRVEIHVVEQLARRRSDVADAQPHGARQLALDGQVVLVDVRGLEVGIDALVAERRRIGERHAAGERVAQAAAAPRRRVAELVGRQQVANALHGNGRVEEAEAAAQHGLVALVEAPGKADARAEIVHVGVEQRVGQARFRCQQRAVERNQTGRQLRRDLRARHDVVAAVVEDEVGQQTAVLVPRADDLVAQAQEDRQGSVHFPVVLPNTAKSFE